MVELTSAENRLLSMYTGMTPPYRLEQDQNRYGWAIGQLRANLYNSRADNFSSRLLLAKLLFLYPDLNDLYMPISSSVYREFRPLQVLWSYADSFYYQRERKSSATRAMMGSIPLTALYNIGLVAVGGMNSTCVPWEAFKSLYASLRVLKSDEGRTTDCTVCGLTKITYKTCPWCLTIPGGEKKSAEDKVAKNLFREAVQRSSPPSWAGTTTASSSNPSLYFSSNAAGNNEEDD